MFPGSRSSSAKASATLSAFVHRSPLATNPHDPHICLASHCIRSAFGETVQLVADAMQTRGPSSFREIAAFIRDKSRLKQPVSLSSVRASLLVLVQHSICTVEYRKGIPYYIYHPAEAVYILRYARFVELTRKTFDSTAACLVETLLLAGRVRTVDVVLQTANIAPKSDRYTVWQTVLEAFYKLAQSGYVTSVPPQLNRGEDDDDDDDDEEAEFEPTEPAKKKAKTDDDDSAATSLFMEDPTVINALNANAQYKSTLPVDTVWKVNIQMFHDILRALTLGKLVAERYGHRIQSCGSMVTAALRHRAIDKHGLKRGSDGDDNIDLIEDPTFAPQDIVKHLPKPVLQLLEKKVGNVQTNLTRSLEELANFHDPAVLSRVGQHRYQVNISSLIRYQAMRICHRVIHDQHGETAGRIVSILTSMGWLESDKIAEHAMVPAKDTRETLHKLYRSKYVDLFPVSGARIASPANSIYLWKADRARLIRRVTNNVALALWNIRLRRQHQVEVGKEWIERAEQATDIDENDHETDRLNYQRFCVGLERLDNASFQLDETLMVLRDFGLANIPI